MNKLARNPFTWDSLRLIECWKSRILMKCLQKAYVGSSQFASLSSSIIVFHHHHQHQHLHQHHWVGDGLYRLIINQSLVAAADQAAPHTIIITRCLLTSSTPQLPTSHCVTYKINIFTSHQSSNKDKVYCNDRLRLGLWNLCCME